MEGSGVDRVSLLNSGFGHEGLGNHAPFTKGKVGKLGDVDDTTLTSGAEKLKVLKWRVSLLKSGFNPVAANL
ncbi:unnamed protein product [Nippostrongylus brasiliensis]|uniref:Uncharacterized protein n=1 Tax=Nippostrongylus brasiliensis TaxID=27835 RepID=A0A0N4YN75_NIPBR|nr:unnamed protein product [Nippostrongylus brasiliensis]